MGRILRRGVQVAAELGPRGGPVKVRERFAQRVDDLGEAAFAVDAEATEEDSSVADQERVDELPVRAHPLGQIEPRVGTLGEHRAAGPRHERSDRHPLDRRGHRTGLREGGLLSMRLLSWSRYPRLSSTRLRSTPKSTRQAISSTPSPCSSQRVAYAASTVPMQDADR